MQYTHARKISHGGKAKGKEAAGEDAGRKRAMMFSWSPGVRSISMRALPPPGIPNEGGGFIVKRASLRRGGDVAFSSSRSIVEVKPKYGNQPTCSEGVGDFGTPRVQEKRHKYTRMRNWKEGGGTELRNQELTSLSSIVWRLRLRNVDDLYPKCNQ